MARKRTVSRRTALKVTGAAAATALVAGCSDDDDGNGGDDNGNGGDGGVDIEPGTEIEFDGQQGGWVGIAPEGIEDEDNPTLNLEEGEEYEIGWTEGDDVDHNIEIRDDNGDVIEQDGEELATEEGGPEQWLEFEASDEMAVYRCAPHAPMEGDIVVE